MDHDKPDLRVSEIKRGPCPALQLLQILEQVRSLKNVLKVLLEGRNCLNMQATIHLISKHNTVSHCYSVNPI